MEDYCLELEATTAIGSETLQELHFCGVVKSRFVNRAEMTCDGLSVTKVVYDNFPFTNLSFRNLPMANSNSLVTANDN